MNAQDIRKKIIDMGLETQNGHIASALSIVEILIALYHYTLTDTDVFILSKGHGCLAWYVVLQEIGLNPDIRKGHPDIDVMNGICCTTGSLGHGLPVAVGMALAKKFKNERGRVFVLISDGEMQEGTTWESLLFAHHHNLDNLVVIVDNNKLQALGKCDNIVNIGNMKRKIQSFGCYVTKVSGHCISNIVDVLKYNELSKNKSMIIIAETIKGKGVSFMENNPMWHNRIPNEDEMGIIREELYA